MFRQLDLAEIDGERHDIDEFIGRLEAGDEPTTADRIDDSRRRLTQTKRGKRSEAAQALAIDILNSGAASDHIEELHAALKTAFTECWRDRKRRLDDAVVVVRTMIELYWQQLPLPRWTAQAANDVASHSEQMGRVDFVADALTVAALCKLAAGDRSGGLETLLASIATHDEFSLSSESSIIRSLAGRANEYARQFALHEAIDLGDVGLVAELIESARLQVEPLTAQHMRVGTLRRSRIGNLRPVSVVGHSRLAPHYRRIQPGPLVELLDAISSAGGPDASWWGCWTVNERVYWALLLDGQWACGEISLSEGTRLRELMTKALKTSPQSGRGSLDEILQGPWCRTAFAEEDTAVELGEALLPGPLKERIRGTPRMHALSLVVSGNLLALVPVSLLGVRVDILTSRRLVESATLRLAPPATLVDRLAQRPATGSEAFPLHLACVDPRGDLRNSREAPAGARQILTGEPASNLPPPSLAALTAALNAHPPGTQGLFYYSGHTESVGAGGDDGDALALYGGDALSAAQIFTGVAEGNGPYFPERVLLSACASSGAQGAGSGEWLGLTAAVLWAGARQVIATTWPIWDTHFTSRFDRDLAAALQRGGDPAMALRDLQLASLDAWRSSDHDLAESARFSVLEELPFPLTWSAFFCVGIRS